LVSRSERVLITGGTGFTGRQLSARLRDAGYDVVALSHETNDSATLSIDLRDLDKLADALSTVRPNAVVHLAGIAAPSYGNVGEIYSANIVGTANLFVALTAAKIEPRIVVVASSAQVYDFPNTVKEITEDCPLAPRTHYAVSKRATEEIAAIYSRQFPIIVTRPFNYTGPGQTTSFIVPKIVQHYVERRNEIRLGNLDLFRDFSDIDRVVEVYSRLLSALIKPTTVNICSGRAVYLADILKIMDEISGHPLRAVTESLFVRGDEPRYIVGSPSRLEGLVGPLPNPDFRETLTRIYNWFLQQRRVALG
jgi:nucleoside-diphosphate-sugar epimerase